MLVYQRVTRNRNSWLLLFGPFGFKHLHSIHQMTSYSLLVDNITLFFPLLLESIPKFNDKMPILDCFTMKLQPLDLSLLVPSILVSQKNSRTREVPQPSPSPLRAVAQPVQPMPVTQRAPQVMQALRWASGGAGGCLKSMGKPNSAMAS